LYRFSPQSGILEPAIALNKEKKMNTSKKTAIIVGVLFIVATVSSSLGFSLRDPILDAPDVLFQVASNAPQVSASVLLVLINCVSVVAISFMLFPILKQQNEAWALGYVSFRTFESVVIVVGEICLLTLLTLSQEFVRAGAPDASHFQTLGTLLPAAYRYGTHVIGILIVFGLTAVILNILLVRSRLVPRWISIWGLIGAFLLLAAGLIGLLGPGPLATIAALLPFAIALQEMVFAVWLIVKGFNLSALAPGSA
jgi:hypothetical protein